MPRKKSNIGRSTRHARQLSTSEAAETSEEREARLETNQIRASTLRAAETHEERDTRLETLRMRASTSRAGATPEERDTRRETERSRQIQSRTRIDLKKAAFNYDKQPICECIYLEMILLKHLLSNF